jgi:hypothetical protein
MPAERDNFDGHVRIKRERLQQGMQFIVAVHVENTDIRELPHQAPQVFPFARPLKLGRALMLELSEPLDRLTVNVRGNCNFDSNVKEHEVSPVGRRLGRSS